MAPAGAALHARPLPGLIRAHVSQEDYGIRGNRGREGVSGRGGPAGGGQHHYSGETSPSAGSPVGGWRGGDSLGLPWPMPLALGS